MSCAPVPQDENRELERVRRGFHDVPLHDMTGPLSAHAFSGLMIGTVGVIAAYGQPNAPGSVELPIVRTGRELAGRFESQAGE